MSIKSNIIPIMMSSIRVATAAIVTSLLTSVLLMGITVLLISYPQDLAIDLRSGYGAIFFFLALWAVPFTSIASLLLIPIYSIIIAVFVARNKRTLTPGVNSLKLVIWLSLIGGIIGEAVVITLVRLFFGLID